MLDETPDFDKELSKLNREQSIDQMADVYIDAMAQALELPEEKKESLRAAMRDLMKRQAEPMDYGRIIETQFHAAQRLQMGPSDTFTEFIWAEGDNDDGLERQSTNITRVLQHCVRMSVFSGGRRIICEGFAGQIELQGAEAADLLAIYKTVRPNSLLFKPLSEAVSDRGAGSVGYSGPDAAPGVVVEPARPDSSARVCPVRCEHWTASGYCEHVAKAQGE
jgi:hypothetical protein